MQNRMPATNDVIARASRLPNADAGVGEWMDDPACPEDLLRANLNALARINSLSGAVGLVLSYLDRLLPLWRRAHAAGAPLQLLDVGTGGADIPRAVARWAAGHGVGLRIAAVDRHPTTARLAAEASTGFSCITIVHADALALPFRDAAFDACLCSIALHHLDPAQRSGLLRRLDRLGRLGFFVLDFIRSPAAYAGVWLLTRCFRNPLIRADGPRSVNRAYTWPEYRTIAAEAGIPGLRLRRVPGFRAALERLG